MLLVDLYLKITNDMVKEITLSIRKEDGTTERAETWVHTKVCLVNHTMVYFINHVWWLKQKEHCLIFKIIVIKYREGKETYREVGFSHLSQNGKMLIIVDCGKSVGIF